MMGLKAIQDTIKSLQKEIEELRKSSLRLIFGTVILYKPVPKPTVDIMLEKPCPGIPKTIMGVDLVLQSGGFGTETHAGVLVGQTVAVLVSGEYYLAFAVMPDILTGPKITASPTVAYSIGFDPVNYMMFDETMGLVIESFGNIINIGPAGINITTTSNFSINGANITMNGGTSVAVSSAGNVGMQGVESVTVNGGANASIASSGKMSLTTTGQLSTTASSINNSAATETH